MKQCPPRDRLEELLEETLPKSERDEISVHVASCKPCQEALERLTEAPRSLQGALSTASKTPSELSARLLLKLERPPEPPPASNGPRELPAVAGYSVLAEIGRGGYGVVYRAVHERLNRTVALKMILAGPHAGRRELTRFRQEAEAVAQLHHPNIVQIFDIGEAGEHPYCALELVEGGSLVAHLRRGVPTPEVAARLLEVLARTVHFAHERGIVHRDLKPGNILLDFRGPRQTLPLTDSAMDGLPPLSECVPKITDFGLAKRLDEKAPEERSERNAPTLSGEVVGTPSYMAPEQAAGRPKHVGPLVDVYSLGAILYEMLTGKPPFTGATALDTVLQVLHEEPARPSRLSPDVPRDLETICLKCLEKTPSRRYQSALELADDLRRFRRGDPVLARPVGPQERFWKWVRRRPTAASLVASIALIILVAQAVVTWQWRETAKARDEAQQANTRARNALYRNIIAQSQLRWRLNDFTGARSSLMTRFNLAPGQEDPRSWEWSYLEGLYASDLLTMQHPESGPSGGLAVSTDGKRIASVIAGQREVRIWSAEDGGLLFTLPASVSAHRLAFRPDGGALAIADTTGAVTLYDLPIPKRSEAAPARNEATRFGLPERAASGGKTTKATDRIVHSDSIVGLAFSPDGKWLATASWDKRVVVQDAVTGRLRYKALLHNERVHSIAFSIGGEWLATGDQEGVVRLWNAATGESLVRLTGHKSAVYGVAFSPTGKRLASAGSNGNVRIWDLEPWQTEQRKALKEGESGPIEGVRPRVVQSLTGNAGAALGLAYSPDGRYLAYGCSDATARVWFLSAGDLRVVFRGHTAPVEVVRFSPNGRRLYSLCPEQGAVKAWDLTRPPEYSTLARTRHPEYLRQDPAATWPVVKVQDLLREGSVPRRAATGPDVEALAFKDGDRYLVSVTVGGKLQTWDTASGMLLDEKELPLTADLLSPAILADFSPDGERLAARRNERGDDGKVVGIWTVNPALSGRREREGANVTVLRGHCYPIYCVRFSSDGQRLATFACDRGKTGRPHEVKVWDADTGKMLVGWEGHGHLFSLAFSPDGKWLAAGGEEGQVEVVDWATGKTVPMRREHKKAVTALAFSRDGRYLASAGAGDLTVRIVETAKWKEVAHAEAPGLLCDLAFSADGKRLAGISRDVVKLWDVRTGQELLTLRGAPQRHRDPAFNARLSFSPNGKRLAGSNWDESISVWEAETPSEQRQLERRLAAEQRAPLWHLQEAEHCLLSTPSYPFAAKFHLKNIDCQTHKEPLPAPLQERQKHLRSQAEELEKRRQDKGPDKRRVKQASPSSR